MPEIISINYYKPVMEQIYQSIAARSFEQIMWFGECHMLPLVADYLAADGYAISAVLDNDASKWGKRIERNWCMPFVFGYTDLQREAVDMLVAGKRLPELEIISPEDMKSRVREIGRVLFFTSSIHWEEMRQQLTGMGAAAENIVRLPTEQEMWGKAYDNIHFQTRNKAALRPDEHKRLLNDILREFRSYCEKKGLRYFLAYGSLLGAVRHKGFIPWDDDIDILMPVEDYHKFIQSYPRGGRYEALDYTVHDDYFFPFAKLVDNESYLHHTGCPVTWMQGAYIDLFPMSGFEEGICFEEQWRYQSLLDVKWYWYYISREIRSGRVKDCREEILKEKFKIGFDSARKLGVLTTLPAKPWILEKKVFDCTCKVSFEGEDYDAPFDYDQYLRTLYGDYKKLPPPEEQRIHGFPSYRRLM